LLHSADDAYLHLLLTAVARGCCSGFTLAVAGTELALAAAPGHCLSSAASSSVASASPVRDPGTSAQKCFASYAERHFGDPRKVVRFCAVRDAFYFYSSSRAVIIQKELWEEYKAKVNDKNLDVDRVFLYLLSWWIGSERSGFINNNQGAGSLEELGSTCKLMDGLSGEMQLNPSHPGCCFQLSGLDWK
jgi:hypothetical protein